MLKDNGDNNEWDFFLGENTVKEWDMQVNESSSVVIYYREKLVKCHEREWQKGRDMDTGEASDWNGLSGEMLPFEEASGALCPQQPLWPSGPRVVTLFAQRLLGHPGSISLPKYLILASQLDNKWFEPFLFFSTFLKASCDTWGSIII